MPVNPKNTFFLVLSACAMLALPMAAHPENGTRPCKRLGRMTDCIMVPLAGSDEEKQSKSFQPPAGEKGRIYILRPYTQEPARKSEILIDGKPAAELAPLTYAVFDLPPGRHEIRIRTGDETTLPVGISGGEIRYLQYQRNQMAGRVSGEITVLDEKDGQSKVMQARQAAGSPD